MKYLLPLVLFLTSCTSQVNGKPCIGVVDDELPGTTYEVSVWNAIVAVIFSETIVVPVYTVAKQIKCPTK